jgi:tRNA 2-selenouridine synthase
LNGGYKAFRRFVLDQFIVERKFRVSWRTYRFSGKTDLLMLMKEAGHQVIDLEGLANHRGSAFRFFGNETAAKK